MSESSKIGTPNMGVTPGIRTKMKILVFYVLDLVIVVGWWGFSEVLSSMVFSGAPIPGIEFQVINLLFAVWLVLPPYHNPGKRNYQMLIESLFIKSYRYRSFEYYEFDDINVFSKIGGIYNEK